MTQNHYAQHKLLKLCEQTALKERVSFRKAVDMVMAQPQNSDLMFSAVGNRWKGKPLKAATLRNWIDPKRKQYIKDYPNIQETERDQIAAFLPVRKRDRHEAHKEKAKELMSQGYNVTQTAKQLGIPRSAVAKWELPRVIPWQDEALKLHYLHASSREIARRLGLSQNKVARYVKGKPRGPLPYEI